MCGYYRMLTSLDHGNVKDRDLLRGFAKYYKHQASKRDRALGAKFRLFAETI